MNKEDLVLGKKYIVKPWDWFIKNDKSTPRNPEDCGKSFILTEIDKYEGQAELWANWLWDDNRTSFSIDIDSIEPDKKDKRVLSQELIDAVDKIKEYKFIFSGRNASGGGRGRIREIANETITPGFNIKGKEIMRLPGGDWSIPINWPISKVRKLIKGKEIERSWDATEHTHIRDTAVLGNEKKDMPKDFEWCS